MQVKPKKIQKKPSPIKRKPAGEVAKKRKKLELEPEFIPGEVGPDGRRLYGTGPNPKKRKLVRR